jgi:hypothetical protein
MVGSKYSLIDRKRGVLSALNGGFLTSASILPGIHADQLTANNYPNHPELFEKIHLVAPEQHPPAAVHLNAEPLG